MPTQPDVFPTCHTLSHCRTARYRLRSCPIPASPRWGNTGRITAICSHTVLSASGAYDHDDAALFAGPPCECCCAQVRRRHVSASKPQGVAARSAYLLTLNRFFNMHWRACLGYCECTFSMFSLILIVVIYWWSVGSRTPWLSYALRFRLFQLSGHCNRATPAVFPAVIRGTLPTPVRWLTIQCSPQGLRVILQSFYLVYLRSNATSVAGHQPSYQSCHITFWCCKYDAVLFCVAETNTIHYQNHCHLVLHALRLPLL